MTFWITGPSLDDIRVQLSEAVGMSTTSSSLPGYLVLSTSCRFGG
jgi:hypothetical protein